MTHHAGAAGGRRLRSLPTIAMLVSLVVLAGACGSSTAQQATSSSPGGTTGSTAAYAADGGGGGADPSIASDTDADADTTTTGDGQMSTDPTVLIKTSLGDITAELDAAAAPLTVENFLAYVAAGHYDGTIFHRVIPGFMIQGGGFTADMQQKSTDAPIKNEADNGLKNLRGTLAMARTGVVDSATSQFFINVADNAFLDFTAPNPQQYGYAVFGRVLEGMDVVDAIVAVPTTSVGPLQDVPKNPVVIESVVVTQ